MKPSKKQTKIIIIIIHCEHNWLVMSASNKYCHPVLSRPWNRILRLFLRVDQQPPQTLWMAGEMLMSPDAPTSLFHWKDVLMCQKDAFPLEKMLFIPPPPPPSPFVWFHNKRMGIGWYEWRPRQPRRERVTRTGTVLTSRWEDGLSKC